MVNTPFPDSGASLSFSLNGGSALPFSGFGHVMGGSANLRASRT